MTAPTRYECDVPTYVEDGIIPIAHRLGGPIDVIGLDAEGNRVGVIVNPIDDNQADVVDHSGTAVRLVITPAVEDDGEVVDGDLTPDRG